MAELTPLERMDAQLERPVCRGAIDWVMRLVEMEDPGEHFLSHYVLARKVCGQTPAFAIRVGSAFHHHRLTRVECEGMADDFESTEDPK